MIQPHIVLKLIGVFAIFALSLVGYVLPFNIQKIQYLRYYASDNSWTDSSLFCNLKSFSSGIILGVALLHLIAESVESLMDFSDYPLAVTASSTGILFSIGLDQIVMHYFEGHGENLHGTFVSTIDTGNDEGNSHELSPLSRYDSESSPPAEHMVLSVPMAKMYVLEAAIAAHSIILGFGFGVLDPIETMKKAATLIAAYSIHQFFEGAGIAITIIDLLKNKERKNITIPFGLIFSLAFPFGAVIGLANSSDTFESQLLQGIANAFAGGVLLYSSLVEMISADFSKIILNRRPFLRLTMFISVVCGFLCMAFLATME